VVSVMYLVAFLFLSLPVQIIQFYGGLVGCCICARICVRHLEVASIHESRLDPSPSVTTTAEIYAG
jgi:hypothetical protein